MTTLAAACCCGTPSDGHTRIEIQNYREVALRSFAAEWVGATDVASATVPEELDWGCGLSSTLASTGNVWDPGPPRLYFLRRTEVIDARSRYVANTTWSIPYTGSASATRLVTGWKIASGVSTTLSQSISEVTDRYDLATTRQEGTNSSGTGCAECGAEDGDDADVTIHVEYKNRATYAADRVAFQVYGASGTYAAWTVEVGGGELRVRDGGGTLQYTFTLASYTLGALRTAVNALAELVAIGGDVGGSSAVSSYTATELRDLAATAVTASAITGVNVPLRKAGEVYEEFQTAGYPTYLVEDDAGSSTVAGPDFPGSESQFETGYEYRWTDEYIETEGPTFEAATAAGEPVAQLTFQYGSFVCANGGGTLYDPPQANRPACPAVDPVGIYFTSLPNDRPTFSGVYARSRTPYQEVVSTIDSADEADTGYLMQVCGLADSPPGAAYKPISRKAAWRKLCGVRAKWKLTRI